VTYTNPAAAELARVGQPGAELQGETVRQAPSQSGAKAESATVDLPNLTEAAQQPLKHLVTPERGRWLAIVAAVAIVGIRGTLRWRDAAAPRSRHRSVDTVAADS
jgi:hypothetical protein